MAKNLNMGLGRMANGGTVGNPTEKIKEMNEKAQYNFQFIDKTMIHPNPKNEKYIQEGIESLKESILVNGLRHNLSVIYDDKSNEYRIISGERRYNAICSMTEAQYKEKFPTGIPCKIEKSNVDAIEEEIMLISANHDVREPSIEVKRWEVSRLKELYSAKQCAGEIKNISEEIAKQLDISKRQAIKYMNADKLIPELSNLLNSKGITLDEASQYSSLPEDAQRSIVELINDKGTVEPTDYKIIKEKALEQEKQMKDLREALEEKDSSLNSKDSLIKKLEEQINKLSMRQPVEESKEELQERLMLMKKSLSKATLEKKRLQDQMEDLKNEQLKVSKMNIGQNEELKLARKKMTITTLTSTAVSSIKELEKYKPDIASSEEFSATLMELYSRLENLLN